MPLVSSSRTKLAKLADRKMVLNVGVEAEYFLVRRTGDGGIEVADPLDAAPLPCYDAKGLTRMYDHLTAVSTYMNRLGWTNYANDHEDGNGQFEQNFKFADALTTADRTIVFRYMVHTLAHEAGMAATFMPKPFTHLTGSGLHVHTSLWSDDGDELFHACRRRSEGPRPLRNGLLIRRRSDRARASPCGCVRSDGQLVQAHRGRGTDIWSNLGAELCHVRRKQPDPDVTCARAGPESRIGASTARPTRT